MDKNQKAQKDEEFINDELMGQNQGINEENNEINVPGISSVGINDRIEENRNNENKTKKKYKKTKTNKSTGIETIKDRTIHEISLLDLENENMTLSQFIKKKEKEEDKTIFEAKSQSGPVPFPRSLQRDNPPSSTSESENKEIKKDEEKKIDKNGDKSAKKDGDDEDSLNQFSESEEDEETKKQRELAIEKINRKYEDYHAPPDFNIFDETKMNVFKKDNEF